MGCEIDGVSVGSITPKPTMVNMFNTLTLTNSPVAVREILNSATYRMKLNLTGYTQYRCTLWVAVTGNTGADVHFEASTDGTNFADLDAAGTEIAIQPVGSRDTGWLTIQEAYRTDNVFIRMMEKDGNAALDPIIRQVVLMFR